MNRRNNHTNIPDPLFTGSNGQAEGKKEFRRKQRVRVLKLQNKPLKIKSMESHK